MYLIPNTPEENKLFKVKPANFLIKLDRTQEIPMLDKIAQLLLPASLNAVGLLKNRYISNLTVFIEHTL